MKRRSSQERDEADARERAEARREQLLAELRAREAVGRQPTASAPPDALPEEPPPTGGDPRPPDPEDATSREEPAG